MKRGSKGARTRMFDALVGNDRSPSTSDMMHSLRDLAKARRAAEEMIARQDDLEKEIAELRRLETMTYLHAPGTPEHAEARKQLEALSEEICGRSSPKPPGFSQIVAEGLLNLKYEALHVTLIVIRLLLVVVFNVLALIGLIYFLPTIVEWLF